MKNKENMTQRAFYSFHLPFKERECFLKEKVWHLEKSCSLDDLPIYCAANMHSPCWEQGLTCGNRWLGEPGPEGVPCPAQGCSLGLILASAHSIRGQVWAEAQLENKKSWWSNTHHEKMRKKI